MRPSSGGGKPLAELELRAGDADGVVVGDEVEIRQPLVARVVEGDLRRFEPLARLRRCRCGWRSHSGSPLPRRPAAASVVGRSVGTSRALQKSGCCGFRISVRRMSSRLLMFASSMITASSRWATSACASRMSICAIAPTSTRRSFCRSDRLRQLERLAGDVQLPHRADEVVVGVAHGAFGCGDLLAQLEIGNLFVLLRHHHLLPLRVDHEVAEQWLGELSSQVRIQPRVEAARCS